MRFHTTVSFSLKLKKASFHKMVVPNDTVRMEIKNLMINDNLINQSGKAYVNDKLVAKAEWICVANN
jgi:3-hydroxymyristoyl/3-hydroxydecanoyl-(acyl carrier protein) dehydratase